MLIPLASNILDQIGSTPLVRLGVLMVARLPLFGAAIYD